MYLQNNMMKTWLILNLKNALTKAHNNTRVDSMLQQNYNVDKMNDKTSDKIKSKIIKNNCKN